MLAHRGEQGEFNELFTKIFTENLYIFINVILCIQLIIKNNAPMYPGVVSSTPLVLNRFSSMKNIKNL